MPISRRRRRSSRGAPRGSRSAENLSLTGPRKTKTNKFYLAAAVIIAVLVIGSFGLTSIPFGGGAGGITTGSSNEFVEGVGLRQNLMPTGPSGLNDHVDDNQSVDYNTVPPTSGDHWVTPANCGFYPDRLPDERIVHNLEHGNIVVSYNLTSPGEISQLRSALENNELYSGWGLAHYYDKLPEGQVAVAAWGVLDVMDGIDGDRLSRFFDSYSGNLGPEQISCGASPFQMPR